MHRTEKPEVEGMGTIWLNCPYTEVALELKDALLSVGVRVHDGRKPPVEEAPSAVVLFTNGADLDSEVGRLRVLATHPCLGVRLVRRAADRQIRPESGCQRHRQRRYTAQAFPTSALASLQR